MKKLITLVAVLVAVAVGLKEKFAGADDAPKSTTTTTTTTTPTSSSGNEPAAPSSPEQPSAVGKTVKELLPAMPAKWSSKVKDVVRHTGFTLLYDTRHNTPAWVAWKLTAAHTDGAQQRSQKFWADPAIPRPYRVDYYDYKDSGYDRGHMCPAGDNKWSQQAMYDCFYMSNMCPQDHSLNSGAWGKLESACRTWAKAEGSVYIVCGPVYNKGTHEKIGIDHVIDVPEGFFKAVVSLRKGKEKAIAFYFTNDANNPSYTKLAMTVDEIEKKCGFDLFADLDDELENRIEAKADIKDWK